MIFTILLGFCLSVILVIGLYVSKYRGVVESFGLPYIKPFLIFGSPPFAYHKFVYSDWMINQFKKFGRTWARYEGITPVIVSIDPEFIKQVTVKQFDHFTDSVDLNLKDDETTLDIAKGEKWRELRKILSPTFTSGKMKSMMEPMDKIAERTVEYLSDKIKTQPKIDLKPIIQGFTLDTIAKCGFGIDSNVYKGEDNEFAKTAFGVLQNVVAKNWIGTLLLNAVFRFPILIKILPILPEAAYQIRKMTHDIIEERLKKNIEIGDFVDRLKEHKANLKPPLTPGMMDMQGMIFLTAGFETTANTLGSAIALLAENPHVQEQLLKEVIEVCGDTNLINHDTIKDMHMIEAAIMEVLRLRPPALEHDRLCVQDATVCGIKIPKGTRIQLPNLPAHLDEEFFPEPNSFRPERFLKENADNLVEFTWRPFGSGQRVCIGQRFAMTEMKIFLAKFVSKFKINEVPETKFVPSCGSIFLNLYETLIVELVERQTQ